MNNQLFPPVRIKTKPLIFILERNQDVHVPELEFERPKYQRVEENVKGDISGEEILDDDGGEDKFDQSEESKEEKERTLKDDVSVENGEGNKEAKEDLEEHEDDSEIEAVVEELVVVGPGESTVDNTKIDVEDDRETDNAEYEEVTDPDDLLAMASDGMADQEASDFEAIISDLEERLSSHETSGEMSRSSDNADFDEVLLDENILNDIQTLTGLDFKDSKPDLGQLKKALRSILTDYKKQTDNVGSNRLNDSSESKGKRKSNKVKSDDEYLKKKS